MRLSLSSLLLLAGLPVVLALPALAQPVLNREVQRLPGGIVLETRQRSTGSEYTPLRPEFDANAVRYIASTPPGRPVIVWQWADLNADCSNRTLPNIHMTLGPRAGQVYVRHRTIRWQGPRVPTMPQGCRGDVMGMQVVYHPGERANAAGYTVRDEFHFAITGGAGTPRQSRVVDVRIVP